MKKRLIAALIAVSMALTLVPTVSLAADPAVVITGYGGGMVEVYYEGPAAEIVAASYDNGRMTAMSAKSVDGDGKLTFEDLPEADAYRVFALDAETRAPICEGGMEADASRLIVYRAENQKLPTTSDELAHAAAAAVDAYAEATMLLYELQQLDISDIRQPVSDDPAQKPDPESEEALAAKQRYDETMALLKRAEDAWDQVLKAGAVFDAAAEKEVAEHEAAALQRAEDSEQLAWAQSLTDHYDAIKGGNKLAQLAKDMGCDAHRAYASLVMAQNILQGHYYNEEGDNAEFWEKTMIATKSGAKVGLFICATILTGGATAASPAGYVTVGEAAGIVLGGVDCTIDVTSSTAKIILGPDSQVVKNFDDKMKPVTDALMVYSIVTGGGSTAGEKMACIFDSGTRVKELYDQFSVKKDENGDLVTDVTSVKAGDGKAAQDVIDSELGGGMGFESQSTTMDAEDAVKLFTDKVESDDTWLDVLIHDLGLDDKSLFDLMRDFDTKVREQIDKDNEDDEGGGGGSGGEGGEGGGSGDEGGGGGGGGDKTPKIVRSYGDDGKLYSEVCFDENGEEQWGRYYAKNGLISREESFTAGPEEGTRLKTRTYYYNNEWDLELTGGVRDVVKVIQQYLIDERGIDREYYGDWYDFNPNGTISSYKTGSESDHSRCYYAEEYDGDGYLSIITEWDPENVKHLTVSSYYTDPHYNGCPYNTRGHLQQIKEGIRDITKPTGYSEFYRYEKWTAEKWHSDAYDWVWRWSSMIPPYGSEIYPMS